VHRRLTFASLALVVGLTAAACSDDVTQKGTAKRDDVIAAANATCQQNLIFTKAHVDAYKARFSSGTAAADQARDFLVNTVSPDMDNIAARFHSYPNPEKDTQKWRDALEQLDKQLHDFKYQIDQDPVALAKTIGTADPNKGTAAGQLFVTFGAKDCTTL